MRVLVPNFQQPDRIAHLEKGETMPNYRVLINDNAHYMDESERADHGIFANADEAIAACKEIVDDDLNAMWKPRMTAKELYKLYVAFGPDPFVVPLNPKDPDVEFSAWTYAKERCKELVRLGD
jgi:hypothetical protein